MIYLCAKFEIKDTEISEQKAVENISSDALNKFNSLIEDTSGSASVHKKETKVFDAKTTMVELPKSSTEKFNLFGKFGKLYEYILGKVIKVENELSLDEYYDEIYNQNEDDFSFDLQDFTKTLKLAKSFSDDKWLELTTNKKIIAIEKFYDTLCYELKIQNAPGLCFCMADPQLCGGFDNEKNLIVINLAHIDCPQEIVNTIAHELWHTYQFEEAKNGTTHKSKLYALNFNNYIAAQTDFCEYEGQLLEAEARAFANQISERKCT